MKKMFALMMFAFCISCTDAPPNKTEVENNLKKAMQNYLYKQVNYDSAQVKYHVLDVTFFEEEKFYDCEFKVNMKEGRLDTTGVMTAEISKDFITVNRKL